MPYPRHPKRGQACKYLDFYIKLLTLDFEKKSNVNVFNYFLVPTEIKSGQECKKIYSSVLCIFAKVVFENFIPVVGKFIAAATLERAGHFQGCTTKGQLKPK